MKLFLLTITILLSMISLLNAYDYLDSTEIVGYNGAVRFKQTYMYLETDSSLYRLLLAPKSTLDSLGFSPAEGDSIHVQGWLTGDKFLVSKIYANDFDTLYWLRYDEGQNMYADQSTVKVDPKKCKACRLCLSPCPTGAISMVNGKAYIDPEKCVECGICIDGHSKFKGCPFGAINKNQ